eukprot:TRINITY_DN1367_c0_g1_i12.p1 TRINITY_DN1367_c0_g1~~TRINITY_DN1367_c0_g1_i12.p1  ORF type:complete len:200 (+),score=12.25 TRINITY_DN1367_c0_g1_i12:105-704(+)
MFIQIANYQFNLGKFPPITPNFFKICAAIFCVIFWIIALGGLAAAQAKCEDIYGANFFKYYYDYSCYDVLRFEWFQLFYELFMLIGLFVAMYLGTLKSFKQLFTVLFLILTVFTCVSSDNAIVQARQTYSSQFRARAAGWIMLSILNFLVLVGLAVEFTLASAKQNKQENIPSQSTATEQEQYSLLPLLPSDEEAAVLH